MADPQGAVALVTGGSRGIGRAVSLALAAERFTVAINHVRPDGDRHGPGAGDVLAEIHETGGTAAAFRADISVASDRAALIDFVADRFGRLDLLVNNAGVAPRRRTDLLEEDEESFDRLIAVNLKGAYFLTQLAARRMIEWMASGVVERPRIVFVSSVSARASSPTRGGYCVSKAGLSMAARLYADRLAGEGIPVLEVRPGVIETDMTAPVRETYDRAIAEGLVPLRRWGRPEDVARVVCAFARGDLDYSTGAAIEVGGGLEIRRL
jgi:3-oxoacyl-[acyl-carrier protein] reductase